LTMLRDGPQSVQVMGNAVKHGVASVTWHSSEATTATCRAASSTVNEVRYGSSRIFSGFRNTVLQYVMRKCSARQRIKLMTLDFGMGFDIPLRAQNPSNCTSGEWRPRHEYFDPLPTSQEVDGLSLPECTDMCCSMVDPPCLSFSRKEGSEKVASTCWFHTQPREGVQLQQWTPIALVTYFKPGVNWTIEEGRLQDSIPTNTTEDRPIIASANGSWIILLAIGFMILALCSACACACLFKKFRVSIAVAASACGPECEEKGFTDVVGRSGNPDAHGPDAGFKERV